MIHPVARKPKRVLAKFVVSAILLLNLNANLMERSSILSEHRGLTRALEGGGCSIEPVAEFKTPDANATRTLLTSYPGSGKRFAWFIMSALTNYDVADDWDFSGNLNENVLTLKTSFPNPNGIFGIFYTCHQLDHYPASFSMIMLQSVTSALYILQIIAGWHIRAK